MEGAWLVVGDINDIKDPSEKKRGAPFNWSWLQIFNERVNICQLIKIDMQSSRFTWKGPMIGTYDMLFERLNCALCNKEWKVKFPKAYVKTLPRVLFDHHLILINMRGNPTDKVNQPFKFEVAWLTHENFSDFL